MASPKRLRKTKETSRDVTHASNPANSALLAQSWEISVSEKVRGGPGRSVTSKSQPVDRVVQLINPILRGWVNYFAVGHSSECFSFIKDWVEKKVRRHMLRARKRKGFGWTRWSRQWLNETLRLFNGYGVR